jgi:hypothetical protein
VLVINEKFISIFLEWDSINIKWSDVDAGCVVESTGIFTTIEKAGAHLEGEAKGSSTLLFLLMLTCLWWMWTMQSMKTPSRWSAMPPVKLTAYSPFWGQLWHLWHLKRSLKHSLCNHWHPEDYGWPLEEDMVWWPLGCPERHLCISSSTFVSWMAGSLAWPSRHLIWW